MPADSEKKQIQIPWNGLSSDPTLPLHHCNQNTKILIIILQICIELQIHSGICTSQKISLENHKTHKQ